MSHMRRNDLHFIRVIDVLRERFGLTEPEYTTASRFIRETVAEGLIKPVDASSRSRKYARYGPWWA